MLLNSAPGTTRQSLKAEAEKLGIDFPILHETSQLIGESLGVRGVGEVLVIDPLSLTLVFRGSLEALESGPALGAELQLRLAADLLHGRAGGAARGLQGDRLGRLRQLEVESRQSGARRTRPLGSADLARDVHGVRALIAVRR